MSREELGKQGLDPNVNSGSSQPRGAQNTPPVSYTQNLGDYQLETLEVSDPEHPVVPQHISADFGKIYKGKLVPKQRVLLISLGITIGVILIITAIVSLTFKKNETAQTSSSPIPIQDIGLQKTTENKPGFTSELPSLLVNGDIIATGSLKVLNSGFTTTFKVDKPTANQTLTLPSASGVICLDSNNCAYANQADLDALSNTLTNRIENIIVPPSGVTELNGQSGSLTIQGTTNQITVSTSGGTVTLSTPQDLANISSPTFAGLALNGNLNVAGIVDLPIDCSAQTNGGSLTTNGAGQIICSADDAGGPGTVTTVGGTVGAIPVFDGSQTIIDSIITQAATTITVTGSLDVTSGASVATLTVTSLGNGPVRSTGGVISVGAIDLATADVTGTLAVGNGGTGGTSFTSNGLVYGNGGGALQVTSAGTGGQILIANVSGVPTFVSMTGDLNISNTGVSTIQLDSVALGADTTGNYVSTISAGNGISGSSASEGGTPTISLGALTANWQQSGAFNIVLDHASAGLQILESAGGAFYGIFDVGDLSSNQTFTFTEGGTVITSGNVASNATTAVTAGAGLIGGGTTGAIVVDIGAGAGISVNANDIAVVYGSGPNTAVQGNTGLTLTAGTNLTGGGAVTLGAGGTVTFNVASSPIFSGNVIAQGGTITVGTTTQQGGLVIHDGVGQTGTLTTTPLPQATTFVFSDPGGATGTVCILENENCVGSGSGVTAVQPSVAGRIAVFTAGQDITGSWLNQNISTIELDNTRNFSLLGGNFSVTGMGTFSNTLTANGDTVLGDNASDTITYTGRVASHILPAINNTSDLGSSTNRWRELYLAGTSLHIGDNINEVTINYDTVTSKVQIDQDVVITGTKTLSVPGQGGSSEIFGAGSSALGTSAVALGNAATANGNNSVALGASTSASGASSIVIGTSASDGGNGQSIILGRNGVATAPNQLVVGSSSTTLNQGYFGNGVVSATPQGFTFNGTGGNGTDIAGADITIAAGRSTGNAAGGTLIFQTSAGGVSGASLNALSERARITSAGNFGIGGDVTPDALFSVGSTSQFQVNSSGAIAAATGITSSGTANLTGGTLNLGAATGSAGLILLHDNDGVGAETVSLTTPNITASYTLTLPTAVGASNQCLKAQDNSGVLFWDNCTGGSGGGLSGSGTNGRIARFTPNGTTIGDSSITDDGTNATSVGDFTIQGGDLTLGTTTAKGSIVLHDDDAVGGETVTLTAPNVTSTYSLKLPAASGTNTQCIRVDGAGQLYFDGCSGGASGSGVGSLNTKIGDLTLQGTVNQITVSSVDASTIGLSLPQNIHTGATPTFAGTTLTGQAFIDGGSDQIQLLVQGNATQTANLLTLEQSGGTDVFTVTNAGNTNIGGTLTVTGASTFANVTLGTANILKTNNIEQTASGNDIIFTTAAGDNVIFNVAGANFQFPTGLTGTETICTTNSGCLAGGGTGVILAPASQQDDASTLSSIHINKTGASGFLLDFEVNDSQRLTLEYDGDLILAGDVVLASTKALKTNNITQTAVGNDITFTTDAGDNILFNTAGANFQFPTGLTGTETICTTNSGCLAGGGTGVILAPASQQDDASTLSSIHINKTGASGFLLDFEVNDSQRLTLEYDGDLITAGDFAVNGGDITASGALALTPAAGSGLSVNLSTTGDFAVNTDDLFVDTSAGFVGVGDATPAYLFTVGSGDVFGVNATGTIIQTLATAGTDAQTSFVSGDTQPRFWLNADGSMEIGTGTAVEGNANNVKLARVGNSQFAIQNPSTSNGLKVDVGNGTIHLQNTGAGTASTPSIDVLGNATAGSHTMAVLSGNTTGTALIVQGVASQAANLLELRDNNNLVNASFNSTGAVLSLGRIAASGVVTKGQIILSDGTTSNFGLTLQSGTLTDNRVYTFPDSTGNATDTVCLLTLANCIGAGGGGGAAPNNAAYITFGNDATLSNERAIAVNATNLVATDGGANSTYTINTIQNIATSSSPQFTNLVLTGNPDVRGGSINNTTGALTLNPAAGSNLNVTLSGTGDFAVNSNQIFADTSSGSVGIGTSSPSALLSVGSGSPFQVNANGSQTISQSAVSGGEVALSITPGNHSGVTSELQSFRVNGSTQTITAGVSTQRFNLFGQPTITAGSALGVTTAATVAVSGAPVQGGSAAITNTYGILVQSAAVGSATNSYGLAVNAQTGATNNYAATFQGGNVGIGTSAPAASLQVSINAGTIPSLSAATSAVFSKNNLVTDSLAVSLVSGTTGTSGINFGINSDEDDGGLYYSPNSDTFSFRTGATSDRVVIQGGNVGIGDTTPAAALTVGASDAFQVDSTGHVFLPAGTLGAGTLALSFTGDTNTGFYSSGADNLSLVTNGISQLSVGTTAVGVAIPLHAGNGSAGAPVYSFSTVNSTNSGIYSPADDVVAISSNGTESFRVNANGQVGLSASSFGTNNRLLVNAYSTLDNLATTQISTNAATNKALVLQGFGSQSANMLEIQDVSGNINAAFNSNGAQLTLGKITTGAGASQGKLVLGDGTTNGFGVTIQLATMTVGSRTITIPDTGSTSTVSFCLTSGNCSGSGSSVTQSGSNANGQIAFFTSANNVTSDSLFAWDDTNNRLGLGVASPTATLHVLGATPAAVSSGNGTAAVAGATVTGGTGGSTSDTANVAAGAGGGVTINSGAGGNATGASGANTGGAGGAVAIGAGNGGNVSSSSATPGTGGSVTITSGSGGTGNTSSVNGTGGAITIAAGAGGTGGSGGGGNGGVVTLQGGAGGSGTNGSGGNIVLQGGAKSGSGTEGSVIIKPQSDNVAALRIQTSGGSDILTVNTTTRKLLVGTGTQVLGAATSGGLYVKDGAEFAGQIWIGDSTGAHGVNIDSTNRQVRFSGNARNDITVALKPEFEGSTLRGDGSSNVGTMVSDICSDALNINDGGGAFACDTGQAHTYYEWTTVETSAQDYDVYVRWKLPSDMDPATGFENVTISMNGWRTDSTNNAILANLYNDEGGVCGTADQAIATASATDWSTISFAGMSGDADCQGTDDASDIRAGEYVTFRFRMTADTNDVVRLGEIEITYKSQF